MKETFFKSFKAWIPKVYPPRIISDISDTDDVFSLLGENKCVYPNIINSSNVKNIFNREIFMEDPISSYYIYETQNPDGVKKRGITVAINISLYKKKLIRFEDVVEDVIRDKITSFKNLQLQLNPITLACSQNEYLFSLIENISKNLNPTISLNHGGALNTVWSINDQELIKEIDTILHQIDSFYIVDGHHRAESLFRISAKTKTDYYLTACIFPLDSIKSRPYHRIISVKNSRKQSSRLIFEQIKKKFKITSSKENVYLPINNQIGLSLFGVWYKLECNTLLSEGVEAEFLHNHILPFLKKVLGEYQIQYIPHEYFMKKINTNFTTNSDIIFTLPNPEVKKLFSANNNEKNKYVPKLAQCIPKPLSGMIVYNQKEHI